MTLPVAVPSVIVISTATDPDAVTGVLTGFDPDIQPVTFDLASGGEPEHGSVTIEADGRYTYTPTPGYVGSDSFSFTVTDPDGGTSTATVAITVATEAPATITGTDGNDLLIGGDLANVIFGGDGLDSLYGGVGNDLINGGAGRDILSGGAGSDRLEGGEGNDIYVDIAGDIVLELADGGIDQVNSSAGISLGINLENLVLIGSAAINGNGNALGNRITGNGGDNILAGLDGNDSLFGGGGNDVVGGGMGDDTLDGGTGDDLLLGGAGADRLTGGLGVDLASYAGAATKVVASLATGRGTVGEAAGDVLDGFENLTGGAGNDTLLGDDGANVLDGGLGRDILRGRAGDDTYVANTNDVVQEAANEGVDTVLASSTFVLGAEIEVLTLVGVGAINGTGSALANVITGNGAANRLNGADGLDTVRGGAGNDQLTDLVGGDTLDGGAGNDTFTVRALGTIILETLDQASGGGVDLVRSTVSLTLGANLEKLNLLGLATIDATGNGLDNVINGNSGANTIRGLAGIDNLFGGSSGDRLEGGDGDDRLFGGAGTDQVFGGIGNDRLEGGTGDDTLTGGAGADTFLFLDDFRSDTVADFQDGLDRLNLGDLREENAGAPLVLGQLLITQVGTTARIQLDLDRNGAVDSIDLDGDGIPESVRISVLNTAATSLSAADFLF